MPFPTGSLGTLRPDLNGALEEFDIASQEGFIAEAVLPSLDVALQSDTIPKLTVAELLREGNPPYRAAGAGYPRDVERFGSDTYTTVESGYEEVVDQRDKNRYKHMFDAELAAAKRARRKLLMNREKIAAALVFNTTTWTGSALTTAVGTPWSTVASATPLTDITAALIKIYNNSGLKGDTLIIAYATFLNLRNCAQMLDRLKYNGLTGVKPADITADILAQALGVKRVLVAAQPRLTSNEGATAAIASVWGATMAMVCKTIQPGDTDIKSPGLGRTFHWTEDGSLIDGAIESYEDKSIRADVIRARHDIHQKILMVTAGHLLTSV